MTVLGPIAQYRRGRGQLEEPRAERGFFIFAHAPHHFFRGKQNRRFVYPAVYLIGFFSRRFEAEKSLSDLFKNIPTQAFAA